jgi:gamma-glutamyltranspeptidase / glutathione hydrolase
MTRASNHLAAACLLLAPLGCARASVPARTTPAATPSDATAVERRQPTQRMSPIAADPGPEWPAQSRPDVMGLEGAVSSDHPLASAAGYEVLRRGGNAIDAAVTMAGVLAVVRPHMNGVGGDAFALIRNGRTGEVAALNGSGRSGALATPDFFRAKGLDRIPSAGAASVSVPGAVGAWAAALERHGTISLAEALAPAIRYAEDGFPVTTRLASDIRGASRGLNDAGRALYLPGGEPPPFGSLLKNPALARTLRTIAAEGAAALYGGSIGQRLAAFIEREGGHLRAADFAAHRTDWTQPIEIEYLGYRVLAFPPPTQGVTLLQQMRMHQALGNPKDLGLNSAAYLNRMIEVGRIAFADRDRWIADPEHVDVPVDRLLDPAYAAERVRAFVPGRPAERYESGIGTAATSSSSDRPEGDGDTVYLTVVDAQGNAVSWIQSLFSSFGSGLVEPETGVVLQNRGALYVLEEGHPQRVAPRKRPFHTLTPHMALRGDDLAFTFGSPGGDGQTQTHIAVFHNLALFGMTPQQAIEHARYRFDDGVRVQLEDRIPASVRAELTAMGYRINPVGGWTATFGGAQMILIDPESGARIVASDPRREAYGIAY